MKLYCLFFALLLGAGCTHRPFTPHAHAPVLPVCDTVSVSYSKNIRPVLEGNCYSCHATSVTAGGGLDLEDFSSFKSYLQYGFRGDGIYGSKFYHCISHSLMALPMPPGYVVDSCSLKLVKAWIDMGAPDN